MMLIKGKKAAVSTGRSSSHANTRVEPQKHWPGLLPVAYQDPSSMYFMQQTNTQPQLVMGLNQSQMLPQGGMGQLFKRELKMPKILENASSKQMMVIKSPTSQGGQQQLVVPGRTFDNSLQDPSLSKHNDGQLTGRGNAGGVLDQLGTSSAAPGEQQLLLMQQYQNPGGTIGVDHQNGYIDGGASTTLGALHQLSLENSQLNQNSIIGAQNASYHSAQAPAYNSNKVNNANNGIEMAKYFMSNQPMQASPRQLTQIRGGIPPQNVGNNINLQDSMDFRVRTSSVENRVQPTDQSPDHTQFTILKAKLFNPQLNNNGGGGSQQQAIDHMHQSHQSTTSHHSTLGPNGGSQTQAYQKAVHQQQTVLGAGMVPQHILNAGRQNLMIDEYHSHNQQQQVQQTGTTQGTHQLQMLKQKYSSGSTVNNQSGIIGQYNQQRSGIGSRGLPNSQGSQSKHHSATTRHHPQGSNPYSANSTQRPDFGRELRQRREQQKNTFLDLTHSNMLGNQMRIIQFGGAQQALSNSQINSSGQVSQNNILKNSQGNNGGIKIGLSTHGSALIVNQKSGGAPILMPLQSTLVLSTQPIQTLQVNSAKVLSSRQTNGNSKLDPQKQTTSGFGTIANQPIVVKDGDKTPKQLNVNSNAGEIFYAGDEIKADIETIQNINQHRPQTTVQLGDKLFSESAPKIEETHSQLTQDAPMKAVTQRDTRQQSQINDKSYTQMLSEGSRDEHLVLKPSNINQETQQLSGAVDLDSTPPPHHMMLSSGLQLTSQNASPTFQNTTQINQTVIAMAGDSSIQDNTLIRIEGAGAPSGLAASELPRPATMANQSQQNVIQTREMIEAQSAAAYGVISGSQSGVVGMAGTSQNRRRQLLSIDSNNPQKKRMFSEDEELSPTNNKKPDVNKSGVNSNGLNTLNASLGEAVPIAGSANSQYAKDPAHPSMVTLLQRQKMQQDAGISNANFALNSNEYQSEVKKESNVRFGSAPAVIDNLIIKRCEFSQRANIIMAQQHQIEAKKSKKRREILLAQMNSEKLGVTQNGFESRLYQKHDHKHDEHGACQRFLERGNKPVPPNYEEQDVLPTNHAFSNPALKQATQMRKSTAPITNGKINLDDFDEEISGINLSKLFTAYGPITQTTGGSRIHPKLIQQQAMDTDENNQSLDEDDEDEQDVDFSSFDEPIVIRLMANMFSQKKSVQEGLEMLPEIPLDRIRRELEYLRAQERARIEKEKRDISQWERHKAAERFISKLEEMAKKYCAMGSEDRKREVMEYGQELSELRQNPFYLALKENKVERERLEKIKELQMIMYHQQQQMHQYQQQQQQVFALEQDPNLKPKNVEPGQFDIFKHTFVDAENIPETDLPVAQPIQPQYHLVQREAKEVFTYYDLSIELPPVLFEHLGDYSMATERQKIIMKDFIYQVYPDIRDKGLTYRFAYHKIKRVFHVVPLAAQVSQTPNGAPKGGKNQPWSKCCKIAIAFQFDRQIGCRVICLEPLCPYNPMDQFFMPSIDAIEELFQDTDELLAQQQNSTQDNTDFQQHPKLRKIMAQEVSKNIAKGMHKTGKQSIRDLLMKSSSLNQAYSQIQMKQKQDMLAIMQQEMIIDANGQYIFAQQDQSTQRQLGQKTTIHEETEGSGNPSISVSKQVAAYENNQLEQSENDDRFIEEAGAYNLEQYNQMLPDEGIVNY